MYGDGRLDFECEHTVDSTDGLLSSCTPETYIMPITNIAPINIIF